MNVEELWPEHAGHDIRYTTVGSTDYRLLDVEPDGESDTTEFFTACNYQGPVDTDIQSTFAWCATCEGQPLPLERSIQ